MKQFLLVGLGKFSYEVLVQLAESTDEIIVINSDPVAMEKVKDLARSCYIVPVYDEATMSGILVENPDVAIIDIPENLEATLMVTHALSKRGIATIIVKSDSDERSEILGILGATRIVQSDREAAARIVPLLFSSSLYSYIPLGSNLVMAEVATPTPYVGMTLIQADLRKRHSINVTALRSADSDEYQSFNPEYRLESQDILLVAGKEEDVIAFSSFVGVPDNRKRSESAGDRFRRMMKSRK